MNAQYAASLFGGLLKIYDDMEDNPLIAQYASSQFMEIIKVLIITSFTYASIHNMNFPIIIFVGHLLHYLITDCDSLSTDFYHAGMILALLLSILMFDISKLGSGLIITLFGFMLYAYIDHKIFPEEYSWKKIIWRSLWVIGVLILLQFPMSIPYYDLMFFPLGYCMISVPLMIYAQSHETSKDPKESKEPKEPKETKELKEPKEILQDASEKEIRIPMESST